MIRVCGARLTHDWWWTKFTQLLISPLQNTQPTTTSPSPSMSLIKISPEIIKSVSHCAAAAAAAGLLTIPRNKYEALVVRKGKKITSPQSYADANADISPLSVYLCSGQCSECMWGKRISLNTLDICHCWYYMYSECEISLCNNIIIYSLIYSSQIIVCHVYRYISLTLTIDLKAKILQIFHILQGVPYYWAHFVFVIFSGSRAHTEELFIAIG